MSFRGIKIIVTGGSGFIGSNLIKSLKKKNAEVFNFDKSTGYDITNAKQIENTVRNKFDIIYHLAAFSGGQNSNQNSLECFEINTIATIKMFESILQFSPQTKIILSSSRLEYGNPVYLPVDEKHPTHPTSVYGLSKLASTLTALILNKTNKLRVTIFRTSNVYGPHQEGNFKGYNLVNYFIDQAKEDKDLVIFGDGNQERDYLHIDDLVSAFELAAINPTEGQIFNLGSGAGIKFKDMARDITKLVGKGSIKFVQWPKDFKQVETGSYISNIEKIKKIGFSPKISFKRGLEQTIKEQI